MNQTVLRRWAALVILASFGAAAAAFTPSLWLRSLLAAASFLGAACWILAAARRFLQDSARAESLARGWEEEKKRRRQLEILGAELLRRLAERNGVELEDSLAAWHGEIGGEIRLLLEDASLVREDLAMISPEVSAIAGIHGPAARKKVEEAASFAAEAAEKAVVLEGEVHALHEQAAGFRQALTALRAELGELARVHRQEVEEEESALSAGAEALRKWRGPMEELGQAVQFATDLAEQARILGVNASIEALRSGESGRGFSLVAEEAERLSERMLRLAHQVAAQIEATERVIRWIEREVEKARASLGRLAESGRRLDERSRETPPDPVRDLPSAGQLESAIGRARKEIETLDGALREILGRLQVMPAGEARTAVENVFEAAGRVARKMNSFPLHLEKARMMEGRLAAVEEAARELGAALEFPGAPAFAGEPAGRSRAAFSAGGTGPASSGG